MLHGNAGIGSNCRQKIDLLRKAQSHFFLAIPFRQRSLEVLIRCHDYKLQLEQTQKNGDSPFVFAEKWQGRSQVESIWRRRQSVSAASTRSWQKSHSNEGKWEAIYMEREIKTWSFAQQKPFYALISNSPELFSFSLKVLATWRKTNPLVKSTAYSKGSILPCSKNYQTRIWPDWQHIKMTRTAWLSFTHCRVLASASSLRWAPTSESSDPNQPVKPAMPVFEETKLSKWKTINKLCNFIRQPLSMHQLFIKVFSVEKPILCLPLILLLNLLVRRLPMEINK